MFVAGVGSGIGRACVCTFAAAGANVACFDVDAAAADESVAAIGAQGRVFTGDARRVDDLRSALDASTRRIRAARRRSRRHRRDALGSDHRALRRGVGRELRSRVAPVLQPGAGRGSRPRRPGPGAIVAISSVSGLRSAPLHGAVRRGQGGPDVARAHARDGARRAVACASTRSLPGRGAHASRRSDDERRPARRVGREHSARPHGHSRRHRARSCCSSRRTSRRTSPGRRWSSTAARPRSSRSHCGPDHESGSGSSTSRCRSR